MDPLKEMFNKAFYEHLAKEIAKIEKQFKHNEFVKAVTDNFEDLSLNQRMRNTTLMLKQFLPDDFKKNINLFTEVIPHTKGGYTNLVFPDFVSQFGLDDIKTSMNALKFFTQFGSSEFAIREFLKRDFKTTIRVMEQWSNDKNHHVRRLASEGSRPRLPWSFNLDAVIENPKLTKTILENLKEDNELYVRKSVANHLNDISKEHADYMIDLINTWDKKNSHTAWIIKHASRTLIKKGHSASLQVFDFEKNPKIRIENFRLNKSKIKLGETLVFEFDVVSEKNRSQKLVIDYIIHYRKKSGELSPKVFKLKEINLLANQTVRIEKKQIIKDFTTRKHFAGKHVLEIQVNGQKISSKIFILEI